MSVASTSKIQRTHVVYDRYSQDQLNLWLAKGWEVVNTATYTDEGMNHSYRGPNDSIVNYSHRTGVFVVIEKDHTQQEIVDRIKLEEHSFHEKYSKV